LNDNYAVNNIAANLNTGKTFYIKNANINGSSTQPYTNNHNTLASVIKKNSDLILQSDGSTWQQLSNYSKSTLTKISDNVFTFSNGTDPNVSFIAENIDIDYPSVLPGMIARFRADFEDTIIDDTNPNLDQNGEALGNMASQNNFNNNVYQWRDISERDDDNDPTTARIKNNNHLNASTNSPFNNGGPILVDQEGIATYTRNNITSPLYRNNATVKGRSNGNRSHLRVDIEPDLNGSFTFVFVMRAVTNNPGTYASFIASSVGTNKTNPSGASVDGSWQISTNWETNNLIFRYDDSQGTKDDIILHPYNTQIHAYYIEYNDLNRNLKVYVDGILIADKIFANNLQSPIIRDLRLFKNRNAETYLEAEFHEFFLADTVFSVNQKQLLIEYVLAKWGVNL